MAALDHDLRVDVCVIGAGIAGLTAAYLLGLEKKKVVVIDGGEIGGGQTANTTAHLTNAIDDRYYEIERLHGKDGARLAAESHSAAIRKIRTIVEAEKIDCDFQNLDGYLMLASAKDSESLLDKELEAAQRAGLHDVRKVSKAPLGRFDSGPALLFPDQAQFHPIKYIEGLVYAILRDGNHIYPQTYATDVKEEGMRTIVNTKHGTIDAASTVVATNVPFVDIVKIHTKQAAYESYVVAFRVPTATIARALFWDMADPYHYLRLQRMRGTDHPLDEGNEEFLIVGGEDHRAGQANDGEERFRRLEAWTKERIPVGSPVCRWSGQVMETVDGLAFIGRNPGNERIYIITGDSGMGMTHGTIGGMLVTDLIVERQNPWTSLYNPARIPFEAPLEYAKENLKTAVQYGDWLTKGDYPSVDELPKGKGGVIRQRMHKIAAFRDESGKLFVHSAVCPHLGCIVAWNATENTFDCPCHGSKFDRFGKNLIGPANSGLKDVVQP